MKLHPLHSPAFVSRHVLCHGEYPGVRCTGRSTAQALRLLAEAIQQPGVTIKITDHFPTVSADRELMHTMQGMVDRLGLEHMVFKADNTVTFTR